MKYIHSFEFKNIAIFLTILLSFDSSFELHLMFKDISCVVNDKQLAEMLYCRIDRNSQNMNTLSVRFKNLGAWNNKTTGTLKYLRKVGANKYVNYIKPFKFEMCKFIGDEYSLLLRIIYRAFKEYSNFNHSCPITESELFVEKFPIDDRLLFWMPVQKGEYKVFHNYMQNEVSIVELNVFLKLY